jgi:hypothetical protein
MDGSSLGAVGSLQRHVSNKTRIWLGAMSSHGVMLALGDSLNF